MSTSNCYCATQPLRRTFSTWTHLEDIPHANGVVIVADKEEPPTFGKVQCRSTEHNGTVGEDGYLLPSPHVKQTALDVGREGGMWRGGRGREVSGVQCTNSAVTAGCAEGISSGEEPDLIDGSFMSGKLHLTVPGARVPHTDTAVRTLHREASRG